MVQPTTICDCMHRIVLRLSLYLLASSLGFAQNHQIAVLGGWSTTQGASATASGSTLLPRTSTTTSPSFQVRYSRQLFERAVDLYGHDTIALDIELPMVVAIRDSSATVVSAGGTQSGGSGKDLFFTPAVRFKLFQAALVSVSGTAGFGVASFAPYSSILSGTSLTPVIGTGPGSGARQNSPAFSVGTGIDFRVTQPVSILVDFRDFVTRAGLGGATGRNHNIFQAGLAFHF